MSAGPLAGVGALVTGGGGGLGSAAAAFMARDGAIVTIMGRTAETLVEACARITADLGGSAAVHTFTGDAQTPEDVDAALDAAAAHAGGLGIVVATVGGGVIAPLVTRTVEDLTEELQRNIVTAFLAIKHSVPYLVANGGGSIVCVSSDAAAMSWPLMVGYATAKAGLDAMVRTAADELGGLGIRVNSVRPGLTRTNSANSVRLFQNTDLIREFEREKPLGRTGVPDDVAGAIRYLAGPESSWVTGQNLGVSGGAELRKAPSLESIARNRLGDAAVDAAMAGRISPVD